MQYYRIIIPSLLIAVALATPSLGQSSKGDVFLKQYRALKEEGTELWAFIQRANLSGEFVSEQLLLSRQKEILSLIKRIHGFSEGVRGYDLQRLKEALNQGKTFEEHSRLLALSSAAEVMSQMLGAGADYLGEKQAIYLKVALKYEEIWKLLEEEAMRR